MRNFNRNASTIFVKKISQFVLELDAYGGISVAYSIFIPCALSYSHAFSLLE